jgi:cytochrome c553
MRTMARSMTAQEMDEVASFYARKPAKANERWARGGQNK